MKTIAIFHHRDEMREAKTLVAALRPLVELDKFKLWLEEESITAYGDRSTQAQNVIAEALAVIVVVGPQGVDQEFENLVRGAIEQRIAKDGPAFGRMTVLLQDAREPPALLERWVRAMVPGVDFRAAAEEILKFLALRPRWSLRLKIEDAVRVFPEGPQKHDLVDHFKAVAQTLADGKPLTIMVGPYASVEAADDGSCPSLIRQRLIGLINLRGMLGPHWAAGEAAGIAPLLWQDHLATLCLLSGRTRNQVAKLIADAVGAAHGDAAGAPGALFQAIGALVAQLKRTGLPRYAGVPAVTILTVCPGLRAERALVANGCEFERVAFLLSGNASPELHHRAYRPLPLHIERAGQGEPFYMPDEEEPRAADDLDFVRVVKLFGSRDLDGGVPSGDLGQAYGVMGQLTRQLENFVTAAGTGPYLMLGGGLGTPPLQVAHALLLRASLEKPVSRPRLAIVPAHSASRDPLRQLESGRLAHLTGILNSGLDRLEIVEGDPIAFLDALAVAFGRQPLVEAA